MATYQIKRGDSVSQILKNMGVSSYASKSSWDAVRSANNLNSKYTIYAGNTLTVPDSLLGKSKPASAPKPVATAAPPVSAPTDTAEMKDYLNAQQDELNAIKDYDPFEQIGSVEDVISELGMEGEMPVAPKYEETFQRLREDMGLGTVEASINEYKQMIREQENLLLQQRGTERGKAVRLGVMEGRIDKATQDRQEQISWLSSNVSYLTDVANSAYNYINMTMNFKQMDYQTAKDEYDSEFNRRMSVYNSIIQQGQDDRDFRFEQVKYYQGVAASQLSMYAEQITTGQISWDDLGKDVQTQIYKLEVQAGLPVGFTSKMRVPKGSTIQSITNRQDASGRMVADIIYVDPYTGAVNVEHQDLGSVYVEPKSTSKSGGLTYDQSKDVAERASKEAAKSSFNSAFNGYKLVDTGYSTQRQPVQGADGKVSPVTYKELRSEWIQQNQSGELFDDLYAQKYVNEDHWEDYGGQLAKYFDPYHK